LVSVLKSYYKLTKKTRSSGYGRGLITKRSYVQTPTEKAIFTHHSFGESGKFQPIWHCYMYCHPAKGMVDFEGG